MKRLSGTLGIGLALVWGLLILVTGIPQVQAQTNPNGSTAARMVYLPFIAMSPAIQPPVTPRIKKQIGIHMGNRGKDTDWPIEAFELITGTAKGIWPAATVIQSAQLYNFKRDTAPPCRIQTASIRLPNIYSYLTQALKNGTQVVIRITPSPGNFIDYMHPGITHTLLTGETPAGGNYCPPSQPGELSQDDKVHGYRDIGDIVQEMDIIWHLNDSQGWPKAQIFFEPANEPNNEWYSYKGDVTNEQLKSSPAWLQMDDYFSNLYDIAHAKNKYLQILTPPMAQHNYAEVISLGSCKPMVVDKEWKAGYDFMQKTYNSDRFEGYSWHNYWNYGMENVALVDVPYCKKNPDKSPQTHQLFLYFQEWLRKKITGGRKPAFITEADLYSPCQRTGNSLESKILQWEKTKESLYNFVEHQAPANYVIGWLLVQEDDGAMTNCDHNYEIYWHEAYYESNHHAFANRWFSEWWLNTDQ